MTPEHKAAILAHCMEIAKVDPDYALHAAGWYEKNEPWLLKNLRAKVQQEIRRAQREAADGPHVA